MSCDRTTGCDNMCDSCSSSSVFGWGSCDCGDDGCSSACGNSCKDSCINTCKGTCESGCGKACNVMCSDEASIDLYTLAMASLNKKILASDINNIKNLIAFEVQRRSQTAEATDMQIATRMTGEQMKTLITDLGKLNQNTEEIIIDDKIKCKKSDIEKMQDFVDKSYRTEVK